LNSPDKRAKSNNVQFLGGEIVKPATTNPGEVDVEPQFFPSRLLFDARHLF